MHTDLPPMSAWQDVPWRRVERAIFKLQQRLYRASCRGDSAPVRQLQRLFITSWYAKLLAARRVPQDPRGKRTAGVDGVKALPPPQRLRLARPLHLPGPAQPVRRVWIPKPHTEDHRPLGIPVRQDRARQAVATLALEPAWAATFAPNSYGFRPGRSGHEAMAALSPSINKPAKYVLEADIEKGCDRIKPQALLNQLPTFPTMRRAMHAWLKAGLMDGDPLCPPDTGGPQGAVRSPLRMNVALHGLEPAVERAFPVSKDRQGGRPTVIRYADDLVVLPRHRETIAQAQQVVSTGLQDRG